MTLRQRFAHWGHGSSWHRGRDAEGHAVKLCDACQQSIGLLLAGEMITTPLPQNVPGQPNVQAKRVTRANVARWERSSR